MKFCLALFTFLFATSLAQAEEGFDFVRCGSDIRTALTGKKIPTGTVAVLERRYSAIGLTDLGADEISDRLSTISWRICGAEYMLLQDKDDVVRDVLKVPAHSRRSPEYSGGTCFLRGKEDTSYVVAILDNPSVRDANTGPRYGPGDSVLLAVDAAWKVDEKQARFVKLDEKELRCPRGGIITLDGGP